MGKASEIWKEVKPKIGEMIREINDMESRCEKAQEEAYQRGYETAKHECDDCSKQAYTDALRMESYQKGLSDAWEAARKIQDTGGNLSWWIHNVTAPEAIEKIRQYEQEKKDGVWIMSKANEPSVDTILTCSKCGYAIKIKPHETPELNFCPKCGDCKKPKEEKT